MSRLRVCRLGLRVRGPGSFQAGQYNTEMNVMASVCICNYWVYSSDTPGPGSASVPDEIADRIIPGRGR